jgi:hypothetical protein
VHNSRWEIVEEGNSQESVHEEHVIEHTDEELQHENLHIDTIDD